jgi:predicted TPR repeat methyltransferase
MQPAESTTRDLTVDEAIDLAIALQRGRQFDEAGAIFECVLDAFPNHPRALHYSGVLAHQQGRHADAVSRIERSLALESDRADWHNNLGIALQSDGRVDAAITSYRRAIALEPRHANAWSNLGVVARAAGQLDEAERAYRTAIDLNPDHIDAYTNLGILLGSLKRTEEAVACYCKVVTLRPKHKDARKLLALAHAMLGEVGKATTIFEDWLAEEPDDPIARHMLAACTKRDVPPRASDAFVETTFDGFAASFESKLARLSYRAPALVRTMIEDAGVSADRRLDVLDAGCGTGLCGPLLAPYARRLVGVDLSDGMLTQAREKHVYDTLLKTELTAYLRAHRESFDAIVSADALCYFGDLTEVFTAMATSLRDDGLVVFTLEHFVEAPPDTGYGLQLHGRYSHGRAYVEDRLRRAGLDPVIAGADLRLEAGLPVPGLVVRAVRR